MSDETVMGQGPFGLKYYLSGALAGGICCSITHGALTPVDVVKTRIQLDPVTYNKGMIGGFGQVISKEGAGALLTGLGPTAQGYFIQGWFKFGGVEYFKINITKKVCLFVNSRLCVEVSVFLFFLKKKNFLKIF